MASTLNAGVDGIVLTASSTAALNIQTGGTTRLNIDASGNLLVGTTSADAKFSVHATNLTIPAISARYSAAGYKMGFGVYNVLGYPYLALNCNQVVSSNNQTYDLSSFASKLDLAVDNTSGGFVFSTAASGTAGNTITWSERMRIDGASGNVGIGGTADARTKLQIAGTLPTDGGNSLPVVVTGTIPSGTNSQAQIFRSNPTTQATSFTLSNLGHFVAGSTAFGAGSTVVNQYGFWATSAITNGTNNYGFYSDIASGSNRWNFYAAGTARNYFAGRTDVGNTAIAASNNWNGVQITSTLSIVLASGASIDLSSSLCGGAIVSVYVEGSGNGGLFWVNYSQTVTKIAGNGEATDTGSDFAVYKNAASHTSTLKNKAGSTQSFRVAVLAGALG